MQTCIFYHFLDPPFLISNFSFLHSIHAAPIFATDIVIWHNSLLMLLSLILFLKFAVQMMCNHVLYQSDTADFAFPKWGLHCCSEFCIAAATFAYPLRILFYHSGFCIPKQLLHYIASLPQQLFIAAAAFLVRLWVTLLSH